MKFGQLIAHKIENHAETGAGGLVPGHFLSFKKALYE